MVAGVAGLAALRLWPTPAGNPAPSEPHAEASSSLPDHDPALVLDEDPATAWASEPAEAQSLTIDLVEPRSLGGLVVDWNREDYAVAYRVELSSDGSAWTRASAAEAGNGGRDHVYLPGATARFVRLSLDASSRGQGYAIAGLLVAGPEYSASPNDFFEAVARDASPGAYPKYLLRRQTYWTVVGVDRDEKEALLNEEGMLEVDERAFSIEPFLFADGRLLTWSDAERTQELRDGDLPIPTVTWRVGPFTLRVTAFADGEPGSSVLRAGYRVENTGPEPAHVELFLAIRPFQVNPPWQSLNMVGGISSIQDLTWDGRAVLVNGARAVVPSTRPRAFGAASSAQGPLSDYLIEGRLPDAQQAHDPLGFTSGAFAWGLDLAPGSVQQVELAVPFHDGAAVESASAAPDFTSRLEAAARAWRARLDRIQIEAPAPEGIQIARSIRTAIAHVLVHRDGAALMPGSRVYARAWIRDGALIASALLQTGFTEEAREFVRWYAEHQFPDGRVPCCVDRRGADPTPEHDSEGEFIWAVAEIHRFTRDPAFLAELWPRVLRAADAIAALREKRLTAEYETPEKRAFYGLLPESISHEGYAARPVHSYWDDFFALRGVKDAAELAEAVGDLENAARLAMLRDAFRHDLYASIDATMKRHAISYLPASVELGDFDPTSTAIAVAPGGERANLPPEPLARTYDRYHAEVTERRNGNHSREAYTPYELRNVEALVHLGERQRALEILELILADQRPRAWNQWAEVVWRDPATPKFIGDMPHAWIGAGFVRAVRSLFVYEREPDGALVLAAGLPLDWVVGGTGVRIRDWPTHFGPLGYELRAAGPRSLRLTLSPGLRPPPGGIVLEPPLPAPLTAVIADGSPVEDFDAGSVRLTEVPVEVVLEY